MNKTKPYSISKDLFLEAYKAVKKNHGAAGIDQQTIEAFDKDLDNNLYKLWNRMSSGSYFPPAVKKVEIPKSQGGKRILGIPTVADRVAQMVVKMLLEPKLEKIFLPDSYAYRPNKSALDAVGVTRQRCWKFDWCLEFDIKGMFDNINHDLLMKAVDKHTDEKWIKIYIRRWLEADMVDAYGNITKRTCGTPQGGVISPILSNLFMHYAFDLWMTRKHKDKPWSRYADDGIVHCRSKEQTEKLLVELKTRMLECGLELHPDKTNIILCKGGKQEYKRTKFIYLGYEFRGRRAKGPNGKTFTTFSPAISPEAKKSINEKIRKSEIRNKTHLSIEQVAENLNPLIRGIIGYYGKYNKSELGPVMRQINLKIKNWWMKKYNKVGKKVGKFIKYIKRLMEEKPKIFYHWGTGIQSTFV